MASKRDIQARLRSIVADALQLAEDEGTVCENGRFTTHAWPLALAVKSVFSHWKAQTAWDRTNNVVQSLGGWARWTFEGNVSGDPQVVSIQELSIEDIATDFTRAWQAIDLERNGAAVESLIGLALHFAERFPLKPRPGRTLPGFDRFASMLGYLAVMLGREQLEIGQAFFAQQLSVRKQTVGRWIKDAMKMNLLRLAKEYSHRPGGKSRARTYYIQAALLSPARKSLMEISKEEKGTQKRLGTDIP